MNNPLLLAVGPVVAAAITVGGIWLKEALQRRGGEEARRRRIDQAKAQIDIIEAWARARASLNGSTELAGSARAQAQKASMPHTTERCNLLRSHAVISH